MMDALNKTNNTSFQIQPDLENKFRGKLVQDVIHGCLVEELADYVYSSETADGKASSIAEVVRNQITELKLPQYKYVVHVVIGEQRGEGVKVAARCLWDSDADGHAFDNFISKENEPHFHRKLSTSGRGNYVTGSLQPNIFENRK